eukprot:1160727-Pelagomonas_calceolata.AAC.31
MRGTFTTASSLLLPGTSPAVSDSGPSGTVQHAAAVVQETIAMPCERLPYALASCSCPACSPLSLKRQQCK